MVRSIVDATLSLLEKYDVASGPIDPYSSNVNGNMGVYYSINLCIMASPLVCEEPMFCGGLFIY